MSSRASCVSTGCYSEVAIASVPHYGTQERSPNDTILYTSSIGPEAHPPLIPFANFTHLSLERIARVNIAITSGSPRLTLLVLWSPPALLRNNWYSCLLRRAKY
ncbi:hypothetical protein D9756_002019 [Leucocoprinus leucothites]|uniref:Uncharacterized protein n=1 Tax=Leucocoprinus leucothites TaxID=201217 RepID=A0A8H5GBM2_9AGAR|nr:hypothetical protein D9756_002019 [Leucoagaricus leucothites]